MFFLQIKKTKGTVRKYPYFLRIYQISRVNIYAAENISIAKL